MKKKVILTMEIEVDIATEFDQDYIEKIGRANQKGYAGATITECEAADRDFKLLRATLQDEELAHRYLVHALISICSEFWHRKELYQDEYALIMEAVSRLESTCDQTFYHEATAQGLLAEKTQYYANSIDGKVTNIKLEISGGDNEDS